MRTTLLPQQPFEPLLFSPTLFPDTAAFVGLQTLLVKVPPEPQGKLPTATAAVVFPLSLVRRTGRISRLHGLSVHPNHRSTSFGLRNWPTVSLAISHLWAVLQLIACTSQPHRLRGDVCSCLAVRMGTTWSHLESCRFGNRSDQEAEQLSAQIPYAWSCSFLPPSIFRSATPPSPRSRGGSPAARRSASTM